LLRHLQPPVGFIPLNLDRFSPYFQRPLAHGIKRLRPHPSYHDVFPAHADIDKIAYCFVGDYTSASLDVPATIQKINHEVNAWRARWASAPRALPILRVDPLGDAYILRDTRCLPGAPEALVLDHAEVSALLRPARYVPGRATDMAIEQRLGVVLDG